MIYLFGHTLHIQIFEASHHVLLPASRQVICVPVITARYYQSTGPRCTESQRHHASIANYQAWSSADASMTLWDMRYQFSDRGRAVLLCLARWVGRWRRPIARVSKYRTKLVRGIEPTNGVIDDTVACSQKSGGHPRRVTR